MKPVAKARMSMPMMKAAIAWPSEMTSGIAAMTSRTCPTKPKRIPHQSVLS